MALPLGAHDLVAATVLDRFDEEAVVVIARSTQEGIVVNLDSLRAEVPELDRLIADLSAQESG